MTSGPEYNEVEQPLIDQLVSMGWAHTAGDLDDPGVTGRESFREVLLLDDLTHALRCINLDPAGLPWLDEGRIAQAVNALRRLGPARLMEANRNATEVLLLGTVVDGVEGWEQGRGRTVHFIDWETPENNRFRVINQFRVDEPGGQAKKFITPDLVLFINGIPLVVIEAKSPYLATPMEDAVNQLQRYANRRKALGVVDFNEGNEQLFRYSQFVVATCGEQARVGTFSSPAVHFLEWKDTSPRPMAEVALELGKAGQPLSSQEKLVAGMLRPAHLLDIVRHFTLFMESGGRRVKVVCRYQQFRAAQLAVQRMLTGKTRAEDGEQDRRGGIIWHTQGSGKSLTMVFLIRKMRSDPRLKRFKVVVVTDRRDLQRQLADTAALTGEVLTIVKPEQRGHKTVSSHEVLQETLRRQGKDLVFAMIQKYRGELLEGEYTDEDTTDEDLSQGDGLRQVAEAQAPYLAHSRPPAKTQPLPELNTAEDILVLVDEAHRSHTNTAHANLMRALPNCVKIGFTGTPIIMREQGQTARIFGEFIDRYTIRQSEADGATVPILYEGRTTGAAVQDGRALDEIFEDMLVGRTSEELEAIKQKYATKGHVMEAEALIKAKARNMLRHYVEHILPNGFKAQVVAVSRRATIRYYDALQVARDELVAELARLHPNLLDLDDDAVDQLAPEKAFLVRAHRFLPTIKALEFAPVISGEHNDTVDPQGEWTSRSRIDARIARFKRPLLADGPNRFDHDQADPLAFLIVKSMLLTGFDAPVEQVLYLDRHIKEAELLQAIARVNRAYARGAVEKGVGIVVDYYGVARHLKDALAAYSAEDVEGALQSLKDEIPKLRDRHRRAVDLFTSRGIEDIADTEACVQLLQDEKLRAEFHVKLKQFLATLDLVLPRSEGLDFVHDAKSLSYIQAKARNRYRGSERLIGKEVGEKVRRLIDEHIISLGIDPRIPPIEITADDFDEHVERERSARAKASEMEHALRYHIRKRLDEDPVHYERLSERLKGILDEFEGRWDALAEALKVLVQEARQGRQQDDSTGLDPETQAPFFDLLKHEAVGDETLEGEALGKLCALTIELVDHIQQEIGIVGFWNRVQAQDGLRSWIFMTLDDADLLPFARLDPLADRLMELAKANHHRLVR
jgi:type I restriction enzyme R subunit